MSRLGLNTIENNIKTKNYTHDNILMRKNYQAL